MSMKKLTMLNRILSLGLATALVLSSPIVAYAEGDNEAVVAEYSVNNNSEEVSSSDVGRTEDDATSSSEEDASISGDATSDNQDGDATSKDSHEEQINNGSEDESVADEAEATDEETEDEELEDEELEELEDEKECKHEEFEYESNYDGTHIKRCKECGEIIEEAEECEFDEDGICIYCGYREEIEEKDEEITLEFENDEVIVTVTAMKSVLNGATSVKAEKVTDKDQLEEVASSLEEDAEEAGKELKAFLAYDISLMNDDGKVEPKDGSVSVNIVSLKAPETDEELDGTDVGIVHFEEKSDSTEAVDLTEESTTSVETGDDIATVDVSFETESFSVFAIKWTTASTDKKVGTIVWKDGDHARTTQTVNLYVVNQYGDPIESATGEIKYENLVTNESLSSRVSATYNNYFTTLAREVSVEGYTYRGAYLNDKRELTNISYKYEPGRVYWAATIYGQGENNWQYIANGADRDNQRTSVNVFLVYQDNREIADDKYFSANLFNYSKDSINNASLRTGNANNALIFHDGGDIITNGSAYYQPWNRCNTNSSTDNPTAFQGIVGNTLSNNMPTFNYAVAPLFDPDSWLFSSRTGANTSWDRKDDVLAYKNVAIPFYFENGYYTFDSKVNDYRFDEPNNRMTRTQRNDSEGQFWPFSGTKDEPHFGMNLQVNFNIAENGKDDNGKDTVFEFSGDDDVWVFIDNKLALDIGGIHGVVSGRINFATGDCIVDSAARSVVNNGSQSRTNLYTNVLGYKTVEEGRKALAKGGHTLTFFYLERGASLSNCKITFNFKNQNIAVPTDVYFNKADGAGRALAGAEFGLYGEADTECKGTALYTATSDSTGKVLFSNVEAGTYYMKEMTAPKGYRVSKTIYVVEVVNGTSSIVEGSVKSKTQGSFKIYKKDDQNKKDITTIKNFKNENYKKSLTIKKEWDDNNSSSRPDSITFDVYGTYADDSGIKYIKLDGSVCRSREAAITPVVVTKDDNWTRTLENLKIFADEDCTQIISWNVEEHDISGYELVDHQVTYTENTNITEEILIPTPATEGGEQYSHIDIEVDAVSDGDDSGRKITNIYDLDGNSGKITLIGYYDDNYNWVADSKSVQMTKQNGYEWRADSQKLGQNSVLAFKVRYEGSNETKLVVIDSNSYYPEDSRYYKPSTQKVGGDHEPYRNVAMYYTGYYDPRNGYVDLSGANLFTTAKVECPVTISNSKGNYYSSNYGYDRTGLDFILSPKTIAQVSVEKLGNETHTFTNKNVMGSLTIEKKLTGNSAVASTDTMYGIKVERVLEDGTTEVVSPIVDGIVQTNIISYYNGNRLLGVGYSNDAFNIFADQSVTIIDLLPGEYRVTECYVYDKNANGEYEKADLERYETTMYQVVDGAETALSLTGRSTTVNVESGEDYQVKIVNELKQSYEFKIIKRNANTYETLAGAQFELRNEDDTFTVFYGVTNSEGEILWFNSLWEVENPDAANSKPQTVKDGTYILRETKAPKSFALSTEEWIVKYEKYEGVSVKIRSSNKVVHATVNNAGSIKTYEYSFFDVVAYTLPETGGRGVYVYTIGGVLLMMGAALLLYRSKKNNKTTNKKGEKK
ncbi:LPXTG-motif cell wall anchor domain-containing protein/fibro-slime domain-containing protein [Pseudobutyrivibrio sp. AR14]|nr:LPXTG-motif cell wall anchor domain-containing protein/fibro-slime domain-containing protein [Pseudobutyrivibrio sp. AR14]